MHWDEESLLFDQRSGQTHSLTPLAVEILLLTQQAPQQAPAIQEHIARQFGEFDLSLSEETITETLQHFEALGLVEQCQPH